MFRHAVVLVCISLITSLAAAAQGTMTLSKPPQPLAPLQIAVAMFNETDLIVLLVNVSDRTVEQTTIGLVLDGAPAAAQPVIRTGKCIATVPPDGFLVVTAAHNGYESAAAYFRENRAADRTVAVGVARVLFADGSEWSYPLESKGRFEGDRDDAVARKVHALMETRFPGRDMSWAFPDRSLKGKASVCRK